MLNRKTLLVVGAGGSADFNLPLGPQLADAICKLVPTSARPNTEFADQLFRGASTAERNEMFSAAQHIRRNLPLAASIDSYLDTHRDNHARVRVAKMAIAQLIMSDEGRFRLAQSYSYDHAPAPNAMPPSAAARAE